MSIFRAYDIRGIFGQDLTPEIAEKIGKAFGTYLGKGTVAVGRDNRLSSDELFKALAEGIASTGVNVVDIGTVPTPLLYFSIYHYKRDGGVMITGSHNPPQYNGFKLCKGKKTLAGDEIQEIRKIFEKGKFKLGEGRIERQNVIDDYVNFIVKKIKLSKKIKVVVDAGNGTGGIVSPGLLRNVGCDVVELNCKPDGNFPKHHPDPTVDRNLDELIATVRKEHADFGIAYDGDADRLGVVDDAGRIVRGDQLMIFFSMDILKKKHGAKIICEVKCSQGLMEDVKKHGGVPIIYRTGHSFIKKKMQEENALLAGEMSGHFFFADDYYGYDDGIYASARLAKLLSNSGERLSALVDELPKYYSTPEIRVHCPEDEKFKIVENMKEKFEKKYDVIGIDGARVEFGDGWGLVRASNTEPALILRFEATSEKKLQEIKKVFSDALKEFPFLKLEF